MSSRFNPVVTHVRISWSWFPTLPWDFRESQNESLPLKVISFVFLTIRGSLWFWVASQLTGTHCLPRGMMATAARLVGSAGVEASLGPGSTASIACVLLPFAHLCAQGFHRDSSSSHSSSQRWLNVYRASSTAWGAGGTVRYDRHGLCLPGSYNLVRERH